MLLEREVPEWEGVRVVRPERRDRNGRQDPTGGGLKQ
jgi:hypothetical protein